MSIYVFTPTGVAIGNWIYVTANGDKLFVHMVGSGGADPLHGIGTFTITGGTGRFRGASGSYQQIITFAALPGSDARGCVLRRTLQRNHFLSRCRIDAEDSNPRGPRLI